MTEYNKMVKGRFTSTGGAQVIQLPFQPDYVELFNFTTSSAAPAANAVISAKWDASMGQGTAIEQVYSGTALVSDGVLTNGISTFAAGQLLQYGPTFQVVSISKAAVAVVTAGANHGLTTGDVVVFQGLYQSATTGMPQIAGIPFTVTVTGATTFTIPWDTTGSNYTALSASPAGSTFKKVLYPYLYFPGTTYISSVTLGATTTITTSSAHNFRVGQEVAFRIPTAWGTTQLNSLPNIPTPGSPIYGYVVAVTNYNTVVVNFNSTGYTAFTNNIPVANVNGLSFPQIVAVGDVNTGGQPISVGSPLYPPPVYSPIGTTLFSTINGPAITGAFVNNTSQGFIIGNGSGVNVTASNLVGANGNIIYWRAYFHDLSYFV